jgi:hypothetical protein
VKRGLWHDGRLSWWLVGAVATVTFGWLATDLLWRHIVVEGRLLFTAALVTNGVVMGVYALFWLRHVRK